MKQVSPKKILNKILIWVVIFQAILIAGVLWLFPHPELLVNAREWVQKLIIIILFETVLWPFFVIRTWSINYKKNHMDIAKAIKHALMGPYMVMTGLLLGLVFIALLGGPAPDRGEMKGTWFWKRTGEKIRDVYENDDEIRNDKIITVIMAIGAVVLVFGGIGYSKSGIKQIRQIRNPIGESVSPNGGSLDAV
jgi:hypothetical protein